MTGSPILIVDDHPGNTRLLKVLLVNLVYVLHTAVDAAVALDGLRELRPRVILMDLQLPGIDGLELTRRLKADPLHREVIIIAVTASAMKGDEEKAVSAGCDGYVTKPIDTRSLPKVIASYLETKR